jgi:hypothetical protein
MTGLLDLFGVSSMLLKLTDQSAPDIIYQPLAFFSPEAPQLCIS